ncbi:unnamed protein product [Sympodiomycopsis kandeliae]
MRSLSLLSLLALLLASVCLAAPTSKLFSSFDTGSGPNLNSGSAQGQGQAVQQPSASTHEGLLQLTSTNWTDSIKQGSWLIEFYSPFCSHCKAFLPLWSELTKNKQQLSSDYPDAPFRLAQVNCHAERQICVDQNVPHFPRLTIYRDGVQSQAEYQGDREYTELAKWIDQQATFYRQLKGVSHEPHPVQQQSQPQQQPVAPPAPAPQSPQAPLPPPAADVAAPAPVEQPPPPPAPPAPPAPAPEIVDESLPNPRAQLLQYGITPGLTSIQQLREWLGLGADAADYGMDYDRAIIDKTAYVTAENTNEGSHGTGSNEKSPGYGGARLSADNFNNQAAAIDRKNTIAKGGTFVKFFAPWCPHCKAMAQAYEKLAPELKNKLNILEVDCQANQQVCRAFNVNSYPTLRLYSPSNRLVSEYRGSRSFEKMRDWCHKAAEEEVVDLYGVNNDRHWDDDIARREEVRFLYLTDREDAQDTKWQAEMQLVVQASKTLFTSPFRVYRSSDPVLVARYDRYLRSAQPGGHRSVLMAFRDHTKDKPSATYYVRSGESQRKDVSEWLDWNRYPTLSQVGGESWVDVMNNAHGAPVVLGLLSDENHDGETSAIGSGSFKKQAEIAALKRIALAWRAAGHQFVQSSDDTESLKYSSNGGLLWAWMDADRWRKAIGKYYSLKPQDFPALLLVDNKNMRYYTLPTLRPSSIVDLTLLDPPPTNLHSDNDSKEWQAKISYMGVSAEISTWLGKGSNGHLSGTSTVDDLNLLPSIMSISKGTYPRKLSHSTKSYLDQSLQSVEVLVLFAIRHWFLCFFFVVALVACLTAYVRFHVHSSSSTRGWGATGKGFGTKAD